MVEKFKKLNSDTDSCFGNCDNAVNEGKCDGMGCGCGLWVEHAKASAIICVDEILDAFMQDDFKTKTASNLNSSTFRFWEQVKQSLQNI